MNYFFSDPHFGHTKILQFERKEFKTIQEHDEYIIELLEQKNLQKEDNLYCLGDFGTLPEDLEKRWKALPCRKICIKGNHDRRNILEKYFDKIFMYPIYMSKRVLLSHEPVMVNPGTLNVHGHLHGAYVDKPNYLNVSISVIDYKIISQKSIDKAVGKLQPDSNKFMSEWWSPYYRQTEKNIKMFGINGSKNN